MLEVVQRQPGAWDLSCRDWEERLRHGRPLVPTLPLVEAEAALAVQFFDNLCLPDVPGKPLMRAAAGDWFRDIVRALFGSWNAELGLRFIEEIFLLVPKKNSKTTNGAGLMLVAMLMNRRPRAEFLMVGPTHAISDLAFSQASGMIEADRELVKRFHVRDNLKIIEDRVTKAKLKIKTFDLDILTGPRPAGTLLDEIHLLAHHHSATRVIRQLRGGRASIPEGFLVMLTTQSDEPPAGAFKAELTAARAIRDGKLQGKTLPVLYEFPRDIAQSKAQPPPWRDRRLWPMVLPNLGRSLSLQRLSDDLETETVKGEGAVKLWASQHLDIEIGVSLSSDYWPGALYWDRRSDRDVTLKYILAESDAVCIGIDGGGLDDLLAMCVCGRHKITKHWLMWFHAWCDAKVLTERKEIAPRLQDFAAAGDLTVVEQVGDDLAELVDVAVQCDDTGLLAMVGVDPVGIGMIVDALAEEGIGGETDKTKDRVIGVSQGWRLTGAVKTVERKLADGTLHHGGQEMMTWCAGNARTEARGNAVLVTKQASGKSKIDPLMAGFDAAALMATSPVAPRRKVDVSDFLKHAVVA